jgi:hypothetical protein
MRTQICLLAMLLLAAQAAWAAPESSPPPDYRPPGTRELCPALAEDYERVYAFSEKQAVEAGVAPGDLLVADRPRSAG